MELYDDTKQPAENNEGRVVLTWPESRIDSSNSARLAALIDEALKDRPEDELILDFGQVNYISSAGLRVLLAASKSRKMPVTVREVSAEVYDIMEMTGFTSLMNVERRMRRISIDGCEVIGVGAIGTVYRIDPDTIVKVFRKSFPLKRIRDEQRLAKQAFMKGVPTAIPFDVVRVGDSYGSVFELVNAKTFNDLLRDNSVDPEEVIRQYARLIREVHAIKAQPGELPSCRDVYLGYLDAIGDLIPKPLTEKLRSLLQGMQESLNLVHGDFHMKNIMFSGGEPLLIDMDMLSTGDPVFDYAGIYVAYRAFSEHEPDNSMKFLGISDQMCDRIWNGVLTLCLDAPDEESLEREKERILLMSGIRFLYLLADMGRTGDELGKIRVRTTIERLNMIAGKTDKL